MGRNVPLSDIAPTVDKPPGSELMKSQLGRLHRRYFTFFPRLNVVAVKGGSWVRTKFLGIRNH
jgi:hypothetical protein